MKHFVGLNHNISSYVADICVLSKAF